MRGGGDIEGDKWWRAKQQIFHFWTATANEWIFFQEPSSPPPPLGMPLKAMDKFFTDFDEGGGDFEGDKMVTSKTTTNCSLLMNGFILFYFFTEFPL